MPEIAELRRDLEAEQTALDAVVSALSEAEWANPTPAAGWDVRDSISHLCYFDSAALLALADPDAFASPASALASSATGPPTERTSRRDVELGRGLRPDDLLARWRSARAALLEAVEAAGRARPQARVPWYGPSMSLASFVTARLMETWAHGQDVLDALGAQPVATDRLRHVCHLGIAARTWAFAVHRTEDPGEPIRVEVVGPGGEIWTWGPASAVDRVRGSALEVALVVTQRRHPNDTDLVIEGRTAAAWISVAQAFAGPPGEGRQPGAARSGRPRSCSAPSGLLKGPEEPRR